MKKKEYKSLGIEIKYKYKNTLEIGKIGDQVNHQSKTILCSTYVINRRKF